MTDRSGRAAQSYETFSAVAPGVRAALLAMGKAVAASGLDAGLVELVKLRVSQMNGCLFCLQLHLDAARRLGVAPAAIDHLPVWREASIHDARQRAALDWAEALTAPPDVAATAASRARLEERFSPEEVVFLTAAIANINAWNRIARGLSFPPPSAG